VRILVISDLHANWPALEAVAASEAFDRLIVVGDLVSYGPHPREVVDWVRARATITVRGNHDDALASGTDCRCAPASKPLAEATRAVHLALLAPEQVGFLGGLPQTATLDASGCRLFAVHASPRDHLYRYTLTPDTPDQHLREETAEVPADIVLLGHTHLPMARRVDGRLEVNPGSVGQPRDGNPQAAYAVIEDGDVSLKRVDYDLERTVRDLRVMPIPAEIADGLVSILRAGR
jgi:putative phosphoesterase